MEATYDLTPSIPSICRIAWPSTVMRRLLLYRELRISLSSAQGLGKELRVGATRLDAALAAVVAGREGPLTVVEGVWGAAEAVEGSIAVVAPGDEEVLVGGSHMADQKPVYNTVHTGNNRANIAGRHPIWSWCENLASRGLSHRG